VLFSTAPVATMNLPFDNCFLIVNRCIDSVSYAMFTYSFDSAIASIIDLGSFVGFSVYYYCFFFHISHSLNTSLLLMLSNYYSNGFTTLIPAIGLKSFPFSVIIVTMPFSLAVSAIKESQKGVL
jgi:hypothetical protein